MKRAWSDPNTARVIEALARTTTAIGLIASILTSSPAYVSGLLAVALAPPWVRDWIADNAAQHRPEARKRRRRSRERNRDS